MDPIKRAFIEGLDQFLRRVRTGALKEFDELARNGFRSAGPHTLAALAAVEINRARSLKADETSSGAAAAAPRVPDNGTRHNRPVH